MKRIILVLILVSAVFGINPGAAHADIGPCLGCPNGQMR